MRAPPPHLAPLFACLIAACLLALGGLGLMVDASGLAGRPIVMPWSNGGGR